MKVLCTQENLKGALATVGRIISSSVGLPVLNNVLIKTENGQLKLSSTNLEVAITTNIRCKVEEEGELTVVAKTLSDLINNIPNTNISLESQNGKVKIETENYHTVLKTLPTEEFPLIPEVEKKQTVTINSQELKSALDQVVFAVSTNQTQPEISGVLLVLEGKSLKLVATDRYRLAEKSVKVQGSAQAKVILPSRAAQELSRIIGPQKKDLELVFSDTQVAFLLDETQIISRLIEGQFPDYEQIIPTEFTAKVETEKLPLINALKASAVFSQGPGSVKLQYDSGSEKLKILSESQELGESLIELSSTVQGSSGAVLLNYRYLLDCLNSLNDEKIVIKITNDSAPTVIVPEKQEDYTYLVMPIKT